MTNIDHFRTSFERAVARSKINKTTQRLEREVQLEKDGDNQVTSKSKFNTFKLSEEQYRASIIARAIVHINKHKGVI
ncbi:hypothetical protein [Pseudomonas violetae]|uniref:Uncharacterized protein n=1 Tax=Pseudomonas violetae TaxID=2915813 RepID=A0ABT0EW83_9PSED|nr:hypothetical protein [Pseudomonas violetae]MCK1789746.1 hypothetical protein [Pseudomonas violetae]